LFGFGFSCNAYKTSVRLKRANLDFNWNLIIKLDTFKLLASYTKTFMIKAFLCKP